MGYTWQLSLLTKQACFSQVFIPYSLRSAFREMIVVFIAPLSEAGSFTKEILPSGGGRQNRLSICFALPVWYKG